MTMEQLEERELAGGTKVLGENLLPVLLCLRQIPHDLAWDQTWAASGKPVTNC
jgi:hypothetical protein